MGDPPRGRVSVESVVVWRKGELRVGRELGWRGGDP
jgi:hypothetical protein